MDKKTIEDYYNSDEFTENKKHFEKKGFTKEQVYDYIRFHLINKDNLKNSLDILTYQNIKEYFDKLSTNSELNKLFEELLEDILKKKIGNGNLVSAFDTCIENLCKNHKQSKLLSSINADLNKFTRKYIQTYFNNISLQKQNQDIIKCNLNYIIKKEFGGNISVAIEECISELYKKQIVNFESNLNKLKSICIQEGMPFDEIITATFQNLEKRMIEKSEFIVTTEIKTYQELNRKAMTTYLNKIDEETRTTLSKVKKCEEDIMNILKTINQLNDKLQNHKTDIGKQTIDIIKRAVEQNVEKELDNKVNNLIQLLIKDRIIEIENKVDNFIKIIEKCKITEMNKKINLIENKLKTFEKQNKDNNFELNKKIDTLKKEFDNKLNTMESKIIKTLDEKIKQNNFRLFENELIKHSNKIKTLDKAIYKINDKYSNEIKIKTNFTENYEKEFKRIDETLKSMSKQYVEVMNEETIFSKIKEECSKFNLPDNINDIVTKKMYELNHDTMSSVTHRINDLQSQVTMIHQFNQTTYNMPKTYLFQ